VGGPKQNRNTKDNKKQQNRLAKHGRRDQFTQPKLTGLLKSSLLGVNAPLTANTWDVRSLANIATGTSENERIGSKIQLAELRCRLNLYMSGSITDTSHRTVRQLVVVTHNPTVPGDNNWLTQLFFDGLSADQSSLVN
jgi:hypothetical protein